nr:uncharacterized protein LOC124812504 [Hydra vulgaris]
MVCPKNYSIYRKDRVRIGGGVAIYCRNDVKSAIVSITQTDKDIDIICVDLIFRSSKLRLITCYRPPSYSLDDYIYLESMISIISNLCESVPQFVIVGDFNLPKIDWVNYVSPIEKCHNLFLTLVNNLGMYQYVLEPTRENNILDLVLSNIISLLSNISVECPFSTSDHNSVFFYINTFNYYQPETNSESFYDFKNTDIIAFNSYLSKISWDLDFSSVFTTEEYWNIFSNHLRKGIDRFVPIRTIYHNKKSRSYPKYIYKMLIRKSFLWKRWSITKTTLHKKAFIQYASKCKKAISTHHKNVELKLVKENNLNFSAKIVYQKLKNLKPSTSFGPDGIPNILLKHFTSSSLPKQWLQATVSPIFKKGSTSDANNYRPISLTCTSCRVMESIVSSSIADYLNINNLITPNQHGFLSKRSTCTNLLESTNDWNKALDSNLITDVVYIDFQKAFDSVPHPKLLKKLAMYGIIDNLLHWISAFFSNRYQRVLVGNSLSNPTCILSGVPQGSVLGPTLFLLFINDLPSIVKDLNCSLMLYADDIKLYSSFKDADYSHDLAVAIYKVYLWSKKWQLKIANNKCFTHRIASTSFCKDINYNYQLGDHNLTWSTNPKDLGVTMDSYLNYSNHISNIVRASNIRGYLILKCF